MKWDGQNMFILENMWKCFVTWIWNRYAGYEMGRNAVPRKSCGGPAPVVWAAVAQQPFVCGSVPERRTLAKSLPNLRTGNHWNIWMNPKGVILRKQTSTMHLKKQSEILQDWGQLFCMPMISYDILWLLMVILSFWHSWKARPKANQLSKPLHIALTAKILRGMAVVSTQVNSTCCQRTHFNITGRSLDSHRHLNVFRVQTFLFQCEVSKNEQQHKVFMARRDVKKWRLWEDLRH